MQKQVFHAIPAGLAGGIKFDQWVAVLAFSYFGLKTLKVRCLSFCFVILSGVCVSFTGRGRRRERRFYGLKSEGPN